MTSKHPPAPPEPTAPVGTPPGGGTWAWDAIAGRWVSLDAPPADPNPAAPAAPDTPKE
jgi:hypothetical protein